VSSPLDEQALHQERMELVLSLNGNPVNAEMAWQIIHRWDALVNVAKAAEGVMTQMDYETPHHTRLREALAALGKEPA
jgi:hypothetical protein